MSPGLAGRRVAVAGVSFAYRGKRPVLEAVDLDARPGEVVGLLGRNGSGKTTLLRLLARRLRPTGGTIEVSPAPAVVSDRTPFLEPLSARENLLGTLALRGRPREEARHASECFLRGYGLQGDADRPVREFSLGMRRRLALAEGFAANPDLLLLDEPTLGLDPAGRESLGGMLRERSRDGLTVILATNDAGFAEAVCDPVVLLHEGRIVARGSPAVLVAALGAATVLDISTAATPPTGQPPAGLELMARGPSGLALSGQAASRRLPEVWAWLESAGCQVREVRIREPGLADVFLAHTGEPLAAPAEPG